MKYREVQKILLAQIEQLKPGDRLAEEREMAEALKVSRSTVRQARRALFDEGRIYAVRGRGTFVSRERISKDQHMSSFSEDMIHRGFQPSTRLLNAQLVKASDEVRNGLETNPGEDVYKLKRLRLADGYPMCLERVYLRPALVPGLLDEDLEKSLYATLESVYGIVLVSARQRASAITLDRRDAELLGVPANSPVLRGRRQSVDGRGRLIEFASSLYRPDRYEFEFQIRR